MLYVVPRNFVGSLKEFLGDVISKSFANDMVLHTRIIEVMTSRRLKCR